MLARKYVLITKPMLIANMLKVIGSAWDVISRNPRRRGLKCFARRVLTIGSLTMTAPIHASIIKYENTVAMAMPSMPRAGSPNQPKASIGSSRRLRTEEVTSTLR